MSSSMNKYRNDFFAIRFAQLMQERLPIWKQTQKRRKEAVYIV